MNPLKITIIVLFFNCLPILCKAQQFSKQEYYYDQNFYVLKTGFDAYYSNLNDSIKKEKGYKFYLKWLNYWEPKLKSLNGDFKAYLTFEKNVNLERYKTYRNSIAANTNKSAHQHGWTELGPFKRPNRKGSQHAGIGYINVIKFHPLNNQILFSCSQQGGLYISEDYGLTHFNGGLDYIGNLGVRDIIFNTVSTDEWIVCGDERASGIYRTIDKGETYENIANENNGFLNLNAPYVDYYMFKMESSPINYNTALVHVRQKGVKHYLMKGENIYGNVNSIIWDSILIGIRDFTYRPNTSVIEIVASTDTGLAFSNDGGQNWNYIDYPLGTGIDFKKADFSSKVFYAPSNNNTLYFTLRQGDAKAFLYKYDYSTQSFTQISNGLNRHTGNSMPYTFAVDPTDEDIIYYGHVNLYKKDKGSNIFVKKSGTFHPDVRGITIHPNGDVWLATDGGNFVSHNGGNSFTDKSDGIGVTDIIGYSRAILIKSNHLLGIYHNGSTVGNNENWTLVNTGDGYGSAFNQRNPSFGLVSNQYNISYKKLDINRSGLTCQPSSGDFDNFPHLSLKNSETIFIPRSFKGLYRGSINNCSSSSFELIFDPKMYFSGVTCDVFGHAYQAPFHGNRIYIRQQFNIADSICNIKADSIVYTDNAYDQVQNIVWKSFDNEANSRTILKLVIDEEDPNEYWITRENLYAWEDARIEKCNSGVCVDLDKKHSLGDFNRISDVAHQHFTHGRIFIATSTGIYYTDNNVDTFALLPGLPNVKEANLNIDYCRNKLIVATKGRGLWETDLPAPDYNVEITQNQEWNTDREYNVDVYIKAGATVKVTAIASFNPANKIVVEPGGRLIIGRNGRLTNGCGELWKGVEVLGNSFAIQENNLQGVVELSKGGIIENALIGVTLGGINSVSCEYNPTTTGGIIYANDGYIRNCNIGVKFYPYPISETPNMQPNKSHFTNTQFIFNNAHYKGLDFTAFIDMQGIIGLPIKGCNFTNESTHFPNRGIGIKSLNASFIAAPKFVISSPNVYSDTIRNVFERLDYGIKADGFLTSYPVIIDDNIFKKNISGSYMSGITALQYSRNYTEQYDIPLTAPPAPFSYLIPHSSYGAYFNQCTGYTIEGNYVEGYANTNLITKQVGFWVNSSGTDHNIIRRNSFKNNLVEIDVMGLNHDATTFNRGLQIKCNQFNTNEYDIGLTNSGTVRPYQGSPVNLNNPMGEAAKNLFSNSCNITAASYVNNNPPFSLNYYHHDITGTNTEPRVHPDCVTQVSVNRIGLTNNNYIDFSTECKDSLPTQTEPFHVPTLKQSLSTKLNALTTYKNHIDGGQTGQILTDINADVSNASLTADLLLYSPYLSDSVLLAALNNKPTPLSSNQMRTVLEENSPLSDEVLQATQTRVPPLNPIDLLAVQSMQTGSSDRDELDQIINQVEGEVFGISNMLLKHYLVLDTTGNGIHLALGLTLNSTFTSHLDIAVGLLLQTGDSVKADSLSRAILADEPHRISTQVLQQLSVGDVGQCKLVGNAVSAINNLRNTNDYGSVLAENILTTYTPYVYSAPMVYPIGTYTQKSSKIAEEKEKESNFAGLSSPVEIYPNPNKGNFTITLGESYSTITKLTLYDVSGKRVYYGAIPANTKTHTLHLTLDNGVYILRINNGNLNQQKQIIISN